MPVSLLEPQSRIFRILRHILFWAVVLSFYTFLYGRLGGSYKLAMLHIAFTLPAYVTAVYVTLYKIIPAFLLKRHYYKAAVWFLYIILGAAFWEISTTIALVIFPININIEGPVDTSSFDIYLRVSGILLVVLAAGAIKLLTHWNNIRLANERLARINAENELNFLKSQIQPHFLFNTLNNLYALTLAQDERSPEIVMKLSELLDYMLYQGRKAKIPLSDELKLIANYIELEKLRYDDRLTVEMNIEGKPEGVHIAPLLLFPLVENAFKHGVWKIRGCVSIEILVYISTTNFRFTISNALKPEKETNKNNSGLGLRNLEKRLSLLYENRYSLTTSKKEGKFIAVLTLDLVERGLEP